MVNKTQATYILSSTGVDKKTTVSFKRWLKHFFYLSNSKYYFSKQDRIDIAQAIQSAEQGHVGEIQVVIESYIPSNAAYFQNTTMRARQLFAELGVWDTEYNSGVLLYVNLCERQVDIVFDRGIKKTTDPRTWQNICQSVIQQMKNKAYKVAITYGVEQIGKTLNHHYSSIEPLDANNELSDDPMIL
ncbi:TPM domain-containing protein [Acinetobacter rathckeae]|uniref:TPM domain-containing protein n=1 Tax=Acinetobacter rathckeae TaxID=2605272 RepID=UPI0018A280A1|nr:TPM domain-containing protein [Acinetobacter rathckeae]MBF7688716.1 TPM domain-containing protein [Acinetobacter rathckeae]